MGERSESHRRHPTYEITVWRRLIQPLKDSGRWVGDFLNPVHFYQGHSRSQGRRMFKNQWEPQTVRWLAYRGTKENDKRGRRACRWIWNFPRLWVRIRITKNQIAALEVHYQSQPSDLRIYWLQVLSEERREKLQHLGERADQTRSNPAPWFLLQRWRSCDGWATSTRA